MLLRNWNSYLNGATNYEGSDLATNIYEKDNEVVFEIDVPGYKKEDVALTISHGYLTIVAKKEVTFEKETKVFLNETITKNLKRSYFVGRSYGPDSFKAKVENGVLTIALTRNKEVETNKTIAIE